MLKIDFISVLCRLVSVFFLSNSDFRTSKTVSDLQVAPKFVV